MKKGISLRQNRATTTRELEEILHQKGVKNFKGVFVKALLPSILKERAKGFYIINYGNLLEGTHWSAFQIVDKNNANFFSSYGDMPLKAICEQEDLETVYNNLKFQSNYSSNCGLYCVAWILWMSSGRSFSSFTKLLQDVDSEKTLLSNDKVIINLINQFEK